MQIQYEQINPIILAAHTHTYTVPRTYIVYDPALHLLDRIAHSFDFIVFIVHRFQCGTHTHYPQPCCHVAHKPGKFVPSQLRDFLLVRAATRVLQSIKSYSRMYYRAVRVFFYAAHRPPRIVPILVKFSRKTFVCQPVNDGAWSNCTIVIGCVGFLWTRCCSGCSWNAKCARDHFFFVLLLSNIFWNNHENILLSARRCQTRGHYRGARAVIIIRKGFGTRAISKIWFVCRQVMEKLVARRTRVDKQCAQCSERMKELYV